MAASGILLFISGFREPAPKRAGSEAPSIFGTRGRSEISSDVIKNFIQQVKTSRLVQFKLFLMVTLAVAFYMGTGWVVAGLFGFVAGWALPDISSSFAAQRRSVNEVEAYEIWTAQLANLISAGNHISNSISISQAGAPIAIRESVQTLAAEVEILGLLPALDNFAERARSPYSDQLVLGLKVAYEGGTKIAEVFQELSDVFRKEIEVLKRAESSRQAVNTQILLSLGVSFALVIILVVINRGYLEPFDTGIGQVFLAISVTLFSSALVIIRRYTIVGVRPRLIVDASYLEDDKEYQRELKKKDRKERQDARKKRVAEMLRGREIEEGELDELELDESTNFESTK